jgi:hypothetical protein
MKNYNMAMFVNQHRQKSIWRLILARYMIDRPGWLAPGVRALEQD